MRGKSKRLLLLIFGAMLLQSCYTLLYPPETLPQTVTTVVTEQAMASSLGGSGFYGWDPYWEPALPFTSYHRGYGASYYSPYNYYDYHHPYYAPVYVVSEAPDPSPARDFSRDDQQGGGRSRDVNGASVSSGGGVSSSSGISTAAPVIKKPVKNPVAVTPPRLRQTTPSDRKVVQPRQRVKTSTSQKVKPPTKSNDKSGSESDTPPKRTRTRK